MKKLITIVVVASAVLFILPMFCGISFAKDTDRIEEMLAGTEETKMPGMAVKTLETAEQSKEALISYKNELANGSVGAKLPDGGVVIILPPKEKEDPNVINEKAPAPIYKRPIVPIIGGPIAYEPKVTTPKDPTPDRPIPILKVPETKPDPVAPPAYNVVNPSTYDPHYYARGASLAATISVVETAKPADNKINEKAPTQNNPLPIVPRVKDILGHNLKTPRPPQMGRPILIIPEEESRQAVPPRNSAGMPPAHHIYDNRQGATLVGTIEVVKELSAAAE